MVDEKQEGVYGENEPAGYGTSPSGIREETVRAHPNMTGDERAAEQDLNQPDKSSSVAEELDDVRERAAHEAGSGGMGRDGTPRNAADSSQGEFVRVEEEQTTPG
jgi:hypothetical protein